MRRVLLVHYHFLPVHNVAVKHLLGYARYLRASGWDPVVLTNAWTNIREDDAEWGLSWEPDLLADLRSRHPPGRPGMVASLAAGTP